uniref:UDP-GlcNAc:betaGal beta-1,3-N-acetylglucosaminyltransferase-like protein 1 n=1 Tax=Sinocyclocheilus rhinocerous TaxID=307959 RepID=A0A673KT75_9TELE
MPVFNAFDWLDECLQAILEQDFPGRMELSVYDDGSTRWRLRFEDRGLPMLISGHSSSSPRRVGFAKNHAVCQSSGRFLCFQDADDIMRPQRVRLQYAAAAANPTAIVGCKVCRVPEGSTEHYTRWINSLSPVQLLTQVYTSHGPTVIMPAWFCSRDWFEKAGPFNEGGEGVPEDLLFFYQSLRHGGHVIRVDECLLVYRYHEPAATHSLLCLLYGCQSNKNRYARYFQRCTESQSGYSSVKAFCDVDENKIQRGFYMYEESKERPKPRIPVLHFTNASPPFIVCVKLVSVCVKLVSVCVCVCVCV